MSSYPLLHFVGFGVVVNEVGLLIIYASVLNQKVLHHV